MMREIEFRGKSTKDGTWVYGSYESIMQVLTDRETAVIHVKMDWGLNRHEEVWDDTVGQYTGMKDKTGRRIYDGDIISECNGTIKGVVNQAENGEWIIDWDDIPDGHSSLYGYLKSREVIGNIHDNPGLLKNGNKYFIPEQVSFCEDCLYITHTVDGKCGKCGARKGQ